MIMKTLRYIALAALTLSFAACEQEDINPAVQGDPDAVKINATIGNMQTRVAYSGDNGVTNFVNGDAIKVVNLMRTSKNEATYTTTDGTNWTTTDAMVWNSTSKNKFQAYYPVAEYSSYDMFTIPTDQSDATKLASADWMTASTGEIDKPGNGVLDLNFQHRLAKVTVNLTFSSQYPEGYQHVSDFTFYTNEETQQAITPLANSETSYTAILRPGEYADESYFIYLTMDGIEEHDVLGKTTTAAINLEAGKHYTFTLKVGKDVVSIDDVTVADWEEEEIDGGVAEEVMPNTFDATAMTPEQLNAAVTEALEYGHTEISVTLAADADATMFSAITAALATTVDPSLDQYELVMNYSGTIDLTISGAKTVPENTFYVIENENENWRAGAALRSVTLTDATTIGESAFAGSAMTSFSAPNVIAIEDYAFTSCMNLTDVYLPSVQTLGGIVFFECYTLKTISLPECIDLGNGVFNSCEALETVYAPKATNLGAIEFMMCTSLMKVTLGSVVSVNQLYESIDNGLFCEANDTKNIDLVLSPEQKVMTFDSGTKYWTAGTEAFDFNTTSFIGYTFKSITAQQ